MAAVKQLDLTSVQGFTQAVDWIRQNVTLKGEPERVLAVDVKLKLRGSAEVGLITLFIDSKNGYLFAFRGRDKAYILRDDNELNYLTGLKPVTNGPVELVERLGSDHRSLGTFLPNKDSSGMRGRRYVLENLQDAARLENFEKGTSRISEAEVAGAMSILVCMLAESARWPQVEREFEKIYFGGTAEADEVFKVYDKARRIRELATVFPDYVAAHRIERLVKRANEINELLPILRAKLGGNPSGDRELIELCLRTRNGNPAGHKHSTQRIRDICAELKADANTMAEILSLCSNERAVLAAQSGVIG